MTTSTPINTFFFKLCQNGEGTENKNYKDKLIPGPIKNHEPGGIFKMQESGK
jgi:hypothetical protein